MSPKATAWDELHLAENPAVESLQSLGYAYIPPEDLDPERPSFKEPILTDRLAAALKRLNPWLSDTNLTRAVKTATQIPAASLAEANETLYTSLTYGIALEQDRGDGRKSHTVRFLDFDKPNRNEWVVTRQHKVLGAKKHVIPDIVVFVNGLPLAVIECKSPTIGDTWKAEAVKQLHRYQEAGTRWKDQGAPKLFEAAQILVATCGERAVYGTVGTPERFFLEWKEPYPLTVKQLGKKLGRTPTPQDILLYGLLEPRNLLDIVRNFVVFEVDGGRTVRKLTRYKQFVAVNEAMRRIRTARQPSARGGIVWHTQGSGKSLTMLWLALKLRRDESQQQPTVVIVTDRTKLDRQIAGVFTACGFPNPERADSVRDLRRILAHPTGKTVMTTIQKFQEIAGAGGAARRGSVHPTLSEAANIFVMVDEAHRTQYRSLAANLRQALPNACFLGFTGTPIDKKDRSTLRTFGPYIDTYTIEQAVQDRATVPIFYESRLPELQIIGQTVDQVFDRVFADRTEDERAVIKQRFATEQAIAGAPRRIEAICLDLIDHFTQFIAPNGFKAQVVATSRHAAVTYKETLDRLNAPESAVIMSAGHNDEARLARWHLRRDEQDRLIERFKDHADPLAILVVCDMLLTGFDAPIEQVMYLDAPLKEHTLLQAIARVNRPHGDEKTYGLVVDYWGVSAKLAGRARDLLDHRRPGRAHPERGRAAAAPEPARGGDAVLPGGRRPERPERLRAGAGARGRAGRVRPRVPAVQPVDGHAAAGPARARIPRRPALAGQDSRRGPRPLPRRPARPLGLRGEGPEADCRRRRRGRRPDPGQGGPALLAGVRGEGRGTQDRRGEGERDGARHPPRNQRPPGRESRLLPVAARAAGGDHRGTAPGTPGCSQAALAPEQPARGAEGRADQGAGHRARLARLRHLRPAGGTAADAGARGRRSVQRGQPRPGIAYRRGGRAVHRPGRLVAEGRPATADAQPIKRQLRASGIEADAVESLAADIVDLAKVRTDR